MSVMKNLSNLHTKWLHSIVNHITLLYRFLSRSLQVIRELIQFYRCLIFVRNRLEGFLAYLIHRHLEKHAHWIVYTKIIVPTSTSTILVGFLLHYRGLELFRALNYEVTTAMHIWSEFFKLFHRRCFNRQGTTSRYFSLLIPIIFVI